MNGDAAAAYVDGELDFEIGVSDESRVADLTAPGDWREQMLAGASELYRLALDNPHGLLDVDVLNSSAWRAAEIPAVNGHGDARSVARFYDALLRGELISQDLLAEATRPQWTGSTFCSRASAAGASGSRSSPTASAWAASAGRSAGPTPSAGSRSATSPPRWAATSAPRRR